MVNKELDKLEEMELELEAMEELNADIDIIERQQRAIKRQKNKIDKLIEENK